MIMHNGSFLPLYARHRLSFYVWACSIKKSFAKASYWLNGMRLPLLRHGATGSALCAEHVLYATSSILHHYAHNNTFHIKALHVTMLHCYQQHICSLAVCLRLACSIVDRRQQEWITGIASKEFVLQSCLGHGGIFMYTLDQGFQSCEVCFRSQVSTNEQTQFLPIEVFFEFMQEPWLCSLFRVVVERVEPNAHHHHIDIVSISNTCPAKVYACHRFC